MPDKKSFFSEKKKRILDKEFGQIKSLFMVSITDDEKDLKESKNVIIENGVEKEIKDIKEFKKK